MNIQGETGKFPNTLYGLFYHLQITSHGSINLGNNSTEQFSDIFLPILNIVIGTHAPRSDISRNRFVHYHRVITADTPQSRITLMEIASDISAFNSDLSDFQPTLALITTWNFPYDLPERPVCRV